MFPRRTATVVREVVVRTQVEERVAVPAGATTLPRKLEAVVVQDLHDDSAFFIEVVVRSGAPQRCRENWRSFFFF